ncbi:MAG: hypothetical protein IJ640_06120 [Prevotella sp.]|nr:hypothetical protein [Prevotella sp.]
MDKGEERKLLKAIYKDTPNAEIAKRLGCSVGMVAQKARYLGLKKAPEYLSVVNKKCGLKSPIARNWNK